MSEMKWELLTTIEGRIDADSLIAYLQAHEIRTELFQEGYGTLIPLSFGPLSEVQVFVPKEDFKEAVELLNNFRNGVESENTKDQQEKE